jgi:hypothetical protein
MLVMTITLVCLRTVVDPNPVNMQDPDLNLRLDPISLT